MKAKILILNILVGAAFVISGFFFLQPAAIFSQDSQWDIIHDYGDHAEIEMITLDGLRISASLYRGRKRPANLIVLVPDAGRSGAGPVLSGLLNEFDVAVLTPRPFPPLRTFFSRAPASYASMDLFYRKFIFDIDELVRVIAGRRTDSVLDGKKACAVVGNYYSAALLRFPPSGLDCLVLLSPDRFFFKRDQLTELGRYSMPALFIADNLSEDEMNVLSGTTGARTLTVDHAGRGVAMFVHRPQLYEELVNFLNESMK